MGLLSERAAVFDFQCLLARHFGRPNGHPVRKLASSAEISDLLRSARQEGLLDLLHFEYLASAGDAEDVCVAPFGSSVVVHPDPRLSFALLYDVQGQQIVVYPAGSLLSHSPVREKAEQFLEGAQLKPHDIDKKFEDMIRYRIYDKVVRGLKRAFRYSRFDSMESDASAAVEGSNYGNVSMVDTRFPVVYFVLENTPGMKDPKITEKIERKTAQLLDKYVPFHSWCKADPSYNKDYTIVTIMIECPE
jgi:hypothetical protein